MAVCSPVMSGRTRTARSARSESNGMSTTRPSSETPSSSRTTATAYGASAPRPRGATRMTVNDVMLPTPARGTAVQSRSWHVGQNSFGGMASSPHLPHRIPVRRPARASSKKCFNVSTRSATAKEAHEYGGGVATKGVRQARSRALDLARARFAAKLGGDLSDLRGARGADGVALGLETARRVDGDLAPEARPALLGRRAARARLEEAQTLGGDDLGDREAVVQLDDIHVGGRLAGLPVGAGRGTLGRHHPREVALLVHEHGVGGRLAPEHPDGAGALARDLLGRQDHRGAAVGERTAVEELERVGDVGALEHHVDRDLLLELRLGVERAVAVVLDGHVG